MKKIILITMMFAFTTISAQIPLTTAVDFTATDVEGHEHNLFQVLDGGQYVLIDFFFTTCGPCQTIAPMVNEAYHYFGCNSADVVFWSVDYGDTDAECIVFDQTYGVEYPTISGVEGGGTAICNTYQVSWFPCVILIAPDHNIVEQGIFVNSTQDIIDVLESYGISQNSCSVGINDIRSVNYDINIYPNPANSILNVELLNADDRITKIEILNIMGKTIETIDNYRVTNNKHIVIDLAGIPEGMYFVRLNFIKNGVITRKINILNK